MGRQIAVSLYVAAMVAVIVGVVSILQRSVLGTAAGECRDCFGVRALYLRFLKR